jgi:hypothetical protein
LHGDQITLFLLIKSQWTQWLSVTASKRKAPHGMKKYQKARAIPCQNSAQRLATKLGEII